MWTACRVLSSSCPGLTRASTSFFPRSKRVVDGRVKPGHDDYLLPLVHHLWISVPVPWLVNNSSKTACCVLPSMMTTPCTPCSSA